MSSKMGRATCTAVGIALLGAVLAGCSSAEVDTSTRDASGSITEEGEVGVFKLQVGDCLPGSALGEAPEPTESVTPEREYVESMDAVPCGEPHVGEVVLVDDDFFTEDSKLPSEEELSGRSEAACVPAIEEYTGQDYDTSPFGAYSLTPTLDSWSVGDRGTVCVAVSLDEEFEDYKERTGSAKA